MLNHFRAEYASRTKSDAFIKIDDEKATQYYIKHACNAVAMTQLLSRDAALNFSDKHEMRELLSVAERKRDYFYKKNIDLQNAMIVINAFKSANN